MTSSERELVLNEMVLAYFEAVDAGHTPNRDALVAPHPELADEFDALIADQNKLHLIAAPIRPAAQPKHHNGANTPTLPGVAPTASVPHLPGQRLFGDYELIEEIARGGMGVIFKARQISLNRVVAFKMILAGQFASRDEVLRFRAEAEAAAKLDHPNIVPIYEVGERDGHHFFSMKLIEGGSLSQAISAGLWSPRHGDHLRRTAEFMACVARAVHHAHQHGILHRDLKPGNILLQAQGRKSMGATPFVTDFGLAKWMEGDSTLTQSGAIVGTPNYMAPEQACGSRSLTTAADTYSLGAILYELLTGRRLFQADNAMSTLIRVREQEPEPLRSINPRISQDLETVCLKSLNKDPQQRYASALELAEDLERWLAGEPVSARPVSALERVLKWARKNPAVAGSVAALLGVSVVAFVLITWMWLDATHQRDLALAARREADTARDRLAEKIDDEARARAAAESALRIQRLGLCQQRLLRADQLWQADDLCRYDDLLDSCEPDLRRWEWHYLKRCLWGPPVLSPTNTALRAMALDPKGKILAVGDDKGQIAFWDLKRNISISKSKSMQGRISGLVMHPDGKILAGCGEQGNVRLWNMEQGKILHEFSVPGKPVLFCAAWKPDGKTLAVGGSEGTVWLLNPDNGQVQESFPADQKALHGLVYRGTDELVVLSAQQLRVWNLRTKEVVAENKPTPGQYTSLSHAPNKNVFLTTNSDGMCRVWDGISLKEKLVYRGHLRQSDVSITIASAITPDEKLAITAGADLVVRVWDLDSGNHVQSLRGHFKEVTALALDLEGKIVVSGSSDRSARVWTLSQPQEAIVYRGHVRERNNLVERMLQFIDTVDFHPNGTLVASGGIDKEVHLWEWPSAGKVKLFPMDGWIKQVLFTRDGKHLIVNVIGVGVTVWDWEGGKQIRSITDRKTFSMALSSDGRWLATGHDDRLVRVWDMTDATKPCREFRAHPQPVTALAFKPNTHVLASASKDLWVWDLDSDARKQLLMGTKGLAAVAYSRDGSLLGASAQEHVRVFRTESDELLWTLKESQGGVHAMAFTEDNRLVLGAGRLGNLTGAPDVPIWNLDLGEVAHQLHGPMRTVWCVAVSPDGWKIAVSGEDERVFVWDGTPATQRFNVVQRELLPKK